MPIHIRETLLPAAHEILLADARLPELDALLGCRRSSVEVWLVEPDADGIATLEAAFAMRPAAVHVLAHGEPGRIWLGRNGIDHRSIARADRLENGGDLLLYSCNSGAGSKGRSFVELLARRTGGAVAAAGHSVGDLAQGGCWELDVRVGTPSAGSAFSAGARDWRHLLAPIEGSSDPEYLPGTYLQDVIYGYGGNDTIDAGAGADVVYGGTGNDVLIGGLDGDMLRGEDGDDKVYGEDGNDNVYGDVGDDSLDGGDGNDWIHGGDGDDVIVGGAGTNYLYGEAGHDLFLAVGSNNSYDVYDGGTGNDTIGAATSNIIIGIATGGFTSIEAIDANGNANVYIQSPSINLSGVQLTGIQGILGTAQGNIITGSSQNDTIEGREGDDLLKGGAGDDAFKVSGTSAGFDDVDGGLGDDRIVATAADTRIGLSKVVNVETISSNLFSGVYIAGSDDANSLDLSQTALIGISRIDGGDGDDTILGSSVNAVLVQGGNGNDALHGGALNDTLNGEVGNDTLTGAAGDDTLNGGDGHDLVTGGDGHDLLLGDYGNDALTGDAGNDTLSGDYGDDTLTGGAGNDYLFGNAGVDTAVFNGNQVDYDLSQVGSGIVLHLATGEVDRLIEVERLQFADGAVLLNAVPDAIADADADANAVSENAANGDVVGVVASSSDPEGHAITYGLASDAGGRFAIDGVTGVVTVADAALLNYEAASNHTIVVTASDGTNVVSATMTIAVLDGNDAPLTPTDADTASNSVAETAVAGGTVGITAVATDPNADAVTFSLIDDADGRFVIDPLSGVVTVAEGALFDMATAGSHTIIVQASDNGTPAMSSRQSFTVAVTPVPGAESHIGTSGNDAFTAPTASPWVIQGFAGNDTLTGNASTDTLVGGAGNDTLSGGAGDDLFLVSGTADGFDMITGGDGSDMIRATADGTVIGLTGLTGVETISADGHGGVTVQGDGSANTLNFSSVTLTGIAAVHGGAGNDTMTGSADADTLIGGAGNDAMAGGGGDDLFLVSGTVEGLDAISGGDGSDTIHATSDGTVIGLSALSGVEAITADAHTGVSILGGATSDILDFASVTLTGIERIDAGAGNDTVIGSAGADRIAGNTGNDRLDGGDGDDLFLVNGTGQGVDSVIGGGGIDRIEAAANGTVIGLASLQSVEEISAGAYSGVVVQGSDLADLLDFSVVTLTAIENIDGGSGGDVILGSVGADTITGGAGADTLDGGAGADTVSYAGSLAAVIVNLAAGTSSGGDAQGDQLAGFEHATGSVYNDALTGNTLDNRLQGGAGNDTLTGAGGADTLDGGIGSDTVSYAGNTAAITVDLSAGFAAGGDADGDTLIGIEGVIGTVYADSLTGSDGSDTLSGGAGNDVLSGGAGTDLLYGEDGDDRLDGGLGSNALYGGAGNDLYIVEAGSTTVIENSGAGTDEVRTTLASLTLSSNVEILTYTGTGNFAGTGNATANRIQGGTGDDTLMGGAGADTLIGGDGVDAASYVNGSAVSINLLTGVHGGEAQGDVFDGIETFLGSANNDTLSGDAGANWFQGGAGNDTLTGAGGADTLDGGIGSDTVSYAGNTAAIAVDLSTGFAAGGDADGDTLIGIEGVIGTGYADSLTGSSMVDVLTGGGGNDVLHGGAGGDVLYGDDGDDTLDGGLGNDGLYGGAGNDLFVVDSAGDSVIEAVGAGTDEVRTTFASLTLSSNVEILTYTGAGNFAGTGNATANWLQGGVGNDTLSGGGGADTLNGGDGVDTASYATWSAVSIDLLSGMHGGDAQGDVFVSIETFLGSTLNDTLSGDAGANWFQGNNGDDLLIGGAGADTLDGGVGIDTVSYAGNTAAVVVNLSTGFGAGGDADGDTLIGIEKAIGTSYTDSLTGNDAANVLTGGGGNDVLYGGLAIDVLYGDDGDDTLDGGLGNDALYGGAGNDLFVIDSAGDSVIEAVGAGTDEVRTALTSLTLSSNVEILTYTGTGSFAGTGNATANRLQGGAGNDTLNGGGGVDTLIGGYGNDVFVFSAKTDSGIDLYADLISDFVSGQDMIDLRGIDANVLLSGDQAFTFIDTNGFTSTAGQLRYADMGDGYTRVFGDTDGNAVADFSLLFFGPHTFAVSNFYF